MIRRYAAVLLAGLAIGCGGSGGSGDKGQISISLSASGPSAGPTAVSLTVVPSTDSCDGSALANATVALVSAGPDHIAQAVFSLAPGTYKVCGRPLSPAGAPLAPAETIVAVPGGSTAEVTLAWSCDATSGVLGCAPANLPPQIIELDIAPLGGVDTCAAAIITVTATDAEGDTITYDWAVVGGPSAATIAGDGTITP